MPREFHEKYPIEMRNLRLNGRKLTTPFDIHETLLDILNFNQYSPPSGSLPRGISLFRHIPLNRSCENADIEAHWCACLSWKGINIRHDDGRYTELALELANKTVEFINSLISTNNLNDTCAEIALQSVEKLSRLDVNNKLRTFVNSKDIHGREAQFSKQTNYTEYDDLSSSSVNHTLNRNQNSLITYQIAVTTAPGNAAFELSFRFDRHSKTYSFNRNEISRINGYNQTSYCIVQTRPDMRQFCFCKNRNSSRAADH
jgi:hypothetical protein